MKLSLLISSLCLGLLPLVSANFDLYYHRSSFPHSTGILNYDGWQIFTSDPSCKQVKSYKVFLNKSDVSSKIGIRCKGRGCKIDGKPEDMTEVEMHFRDKPLYHFTIYKNRGYDLIGLDGKVYGRCFSFPRHDVDCYDLPQSYTSSRKFRCLTEATAEQLTG